MITLTKTFSRERALFYVNLFMESDRRAMWEWLGYSLKNALYLREGATNKVSCWYEASEFNGWHELLAQKVAEDPSLIDRLKQSLAEHWAVALPYLTREKMITNVDEFTEYYTAIVSWWSAMANFFFIPNLDVPENIKHEALKQREAVESYSDTMDRLCIEYWQKYYPEFADVAFVISPYEVMTAGREGVEAIDIEGIKKRLQGYGLLNGKLYLLPELKIEMEKDGLVFASVDVAEITQFKGAIASMGKAIGKVRLVLLKSQIGELLEGEVLVTEMTNPDFVSAMKKAAAIITDEGGVTCHAAIVSRELHVPCIIGTKIATQVLKDGDLVEVDANTGIVRKI
jgi:phosphoenolpyruvate synthase/pyruvate phosphate dikinase